MDNKKFAFAMIEVLMENFLNGHDNDLLNQKRIECEANDDFEKAEAYRVTILNNKKRNDK